MLCKGTKVQIKIKQPQQQEKVQFSTFFFYKSQTTLKCTKFTSLRGSTLPVFQTTFNYIYFLVYFITKVHHFHIPLYLNAF